MAFEHCKNQFETYSKIYKEISKLIGVNTPFTNKDMATHFGETERWMSKQLSAMKDLGMTESIWKGPDSYWILIEQED